MLYQVISTLSLGLLWSLLALGVFCSYRVLNVADLTVEGSFPLGAAISGRLILAGVAPSLSLLLALLAGAMAGLVSALLHHKLGIPSLLSGILSMTALYSINLRIMGKPNMSLLGSRNLVDPLKALGLPHLWAVFCLSLFLVLLISSLLYWFYGTELGMAIRGTGYNPQMLRSLGVNTATTLSVGLALSNGLAALCGAVIAQNNGFVDIGMGIGTIVIGLAAVIIAEVLFGLSSFKRSLLSVVVGSLIYRAAIALVLRLGLSPNDLRLLTALVVALALSLPKLGAGLAARKESHAADH